jgi:hypothetical protein
MTELIPREEWKNFFENLSRAKEGWITSAEVMKDDIGAQILSEGLPFVGITVEEKAGRETIDFSVGTEAENHQTHSIENPSEVGFLQSEDETHSIVSIKDESGAATLIKLQPMPAIIEYQEFQAVTEVF